VKPSKFAVVGAGIGGMATVVALHRIGISASLFEQAPKFRRIGAAINLTPNSVKVLDRLGLGPQIRERAFSPAFRVSRTWNTGAETSRIKLGSTAEHKYGAPQLMVHRADLLSALENALPPQAVYLDSRVASICQNSDEVVLTLQDGRTYSFDAVIGADGIHSTTRAAFFDEELPTYTGMAAYRAIFPSNRLRGYEVDSFVKWWGPNTQSQLVTAAINRGSEMFVFATLPEPEVSRESWSAQCKIEDLRAAFADYHPEARAVLAACEQPLKTALYIRAPMRKWTAGRVALLGDACHPMVPFMAQGAAMVLEDVAVLARCIEANSEISSALRMYAATRRERASRIQIASSENDWLRTGSNADWVYGYDAWNVPLERDEQMSA